MVQLLVQLSVLMALPSSQPSPASTTLLPQPTATQLPFRRL